jgi:hypothetical protein
MNMSSLWEILQDAGIAFYIGYDSKNDQDFYEVDITPVNEGEGVFAAFSRVSSEGAILFTLYELENGQAYVLDQGDTTKNDLIDLINSLRIQYVID